MQRIGILRGGISPEYDFSLKTGANVQRALNDAGFEAIDMLLDRDGILHIKGIPADMEKARRSVDMVWNALHGHFGEDGQIQRMLDDWGIAYSGSGTLASALAFNKQTAKEYAKSIGIDTPQSVLIMPEGRESVSEITQRIYRTIAPPWVIKPLAGGASIRTFFAFTPLELSQFVDESISHQEPFLVEQYIFGREAAVGVINNFRDRHEYVLPVIEILSGSREVLSHEAQKTAGYAVYGNNFKISEREALSEAAKKLHSAFNAQDYSQSEFIVDKNGKIWFIEFDTHPHLHDDSPFLTALAAVGATLQEFVKNIINKNRHSL